MPRERPRERPREEPREGAGRSAHPAPGAHRVKGNTEVSRGMALHTPVAAVER